MTTLVAPIFGPVLGGYISDNYLLGLDLPDQRAGRPDRRLHLLARCCQAARRRRASCRSTRSACCLLACLGGQPADRCSTLGKNRDWFHSPLIVTLAIVAVVGFLAWVIWEMDRGAARPSTCALFTRRNFALGTIALCLGYALFFANNLLLPLWLQDPDGLYRRPGPVWSRRRPASSPCCCHAARRAASRSMHAHPGHHRFPELCRRPSCCAAPITPDASFFTLAAPLLLQGIAMTTFFVPLITIQLDGLAPERVPSATGLSNFARITAGSFAASPGDDLLGPARGAAPDAAWPRQATALLADLPPDAAGPPAGPWA